MSSWGLQKHFYACLFVTIKIYEKFHFPIHAYVWKIEWSLYEPSTYFVLVTACIFPLVILKIICFFNEQMLSTSVYDLIFLACTQLQNLIEIEIKREQWTVTSLTTLKSLSYYVTTVSSQDDENSSRTQMLDVKRPQGPQTMARYLAAPTCMDLFSDVIVLSGDSLIIYTESLSAAYNDNPHPWLYKVIQFGSSHLIPQRSSKSVCSLLRGTSERSWAVVTGVCHPLCFWHISGVYCEPEKLKSAVLKCG